MRGILLSLKFDTQWWFFLTNVYRFIPWPSRRLANLATVFQSAQNTSVAHNQSSFFETLIPSKNPTAQQIEPCAHDPYLGLMRLKLKVRRLIVHNLFLPGNLWIFVSERGWHPHSWPRFANNCALSKQKTLFLICHLHDYILKTFDVTEKTFFSVNKLFIHFLYTFAKLLKLKRHCFWLLKVFFDFSISFACTFVSWFYDLLSK